MAYGESNGHVIDDSRDPKGQVMTPIAQYFENSWRCSLTTILDSLL